MVSRIVPDVKSIRDIYSSSRIVVCILEEILMFVLSVGWISRSLEGVSFGQGFSIVGAFFVMNTILTGKLPFPINLIF